MTIAPTETTLPRPEKVSDVTMTLSSDTLNRLRTQVAFTTVGDVRELVADALNTYVHLGALAADGAMFFAQAKDSDDLVKLHLPFSPDPREDSAQ